jgi:hypothetical protein
MPLESKLLFGPLCSRFIIITGNNTLPRRGTRKQVCRYCGEYDGDYDFNSRPKVTWFTGYISKTATGNKYTHSTRCAHLVDGAISLLQSATISFVPDENAS